MLFMWRRQVHADFLHLRKGAASSLPSPARWRQMSNLEITTK